MGMHEGRARVHKSVKELAMRWAETKTQWNDTTARAFESRFIDPIIQDEKMAVSAMDHMAQIIQKIKSDCE